MFLIANKNGSPLNQKTLWFRFKNARSLAASKADKELSDRILQFQFRDIRARAATDIQDIDSASSLLGHTNRGITKRVYRRAGEKVKPTR